MLSGKIIHPADWQFVLQAILDAPIVDFGVLTIVSDEVSGSVGVRQGRYLVGACSSTGARGLDALRQLMSLPNAAYGYLDSAKNPARSSTERIDQQLNVDIPVLLSGEPILSVQPAPPQPAPPNPAPAASPAQPAPPAPPQPAQSQPSQPAQTQPPQPTPAEIATQELRRTFQQLRPVSYYQSQIPPPPGGGVAPKPPAGAPAAPQNQSSGGRPGSIGDGGFTYDPDKLEVSSGTGRKRVNPLDKLIYGAASTCMKLTSLSVRRQQEQQEQQAAAAAQAAAQGVDYGGDPPLVQQPAQAQGQPQFQYPPYAKQQQPQPQQPSQQDTQQQPAQAQQPPQKKPPAAPYVHPREENNPYVHPALEGSHPKLPHQSPGTELSNSQQGLLSHQRQLEDEEEEHRKQRRQQPQQQQPQQQPQQQEQQQINVQPPSFNFPRVGPQPPAVSPQQQQQPAGNGWAREAPPDRPPAAGAQSYDGQVQWPRPDPGQFTSGKMPHMVTPPIDPAEPRSLSDSVRATAWRIASRVAYNAKQRMESQDTLSALRSMEVDDGGDSQKSKRSFSIFDPGVLAIFAIVVVVAAVIAGGVWLAYENGGTRPYINVGNRYLKEGRPDLAIGQFTLAMQKNPADADALQLRAETYEKMGELQHASEDYARLSDLQPRAYAAARKAAYLQFKLRNYDAAVKICNRILQNKPDDESAKAQLAMNLARSGDFQKALSIGEKIDAELVPPYLVPDFLGGMGHAYINSGDLNKAIDCYTRALKTDSGNELNLVGRAGAYMQSKQYKQAEADYAALTKLFPKRAGGFADLARAAYLAGDYTVGADYYQKAIEFSPRPEYYLRLADCHKALGKWGYVVSDCDKALSLQPANFDAAHLRAIAMQHAKNEKAIAMPAQNDSNEVVASVTHQTDAQGKVHEVVTDPETHGAYIMLAGRNFAQAANLLRTIVKRTPQDANARRFLANACLQTGKQQEALAQYVALQKMNALNDEDKSTYARLKAALGAH